MLATSMVVVGLPLALIGTHCTYKPTVQCPNPFHIHAFVVPQWPLCSGVGSTGAPGASAPMKFSGSYCTNICWNSFNSLVCGIFMNFFNYYTPSGQRSQGEHVLLVYQRRLCTRHFMSSSQFPFNKIAFQLHVACAELSRKVHCS